MPQASRPRFRAPRAARLLAAVCGLVAATVSMDAASQGPAPAAPQPAQRPPAGAPAEAPAQPAPTATLQQLPPPPPAPQSQPAQPLPGAAAAQPAPYGYPQRPYYGPAQGAHFYPQQPPATIPYVEGRKPPPGYREETGIRRGYVIAGAVLFGSAYLSSVFAAQLMTSSESYEYDNSSRRRDTEALPLLIPAIGPFISLATLDPDLHGTGWLVLDGFTQMAGVAMFVVGMTTGAKKWVRDEGHAVQVRLTPFRTASHTGLGMVGQF